MPPDYNELWNAFIASQRDNDSLRAQLETLIEQLAKANERIDELLIAFGRAKKRRASSKKGSQQADPPAELSDAQRKAFKERPKPPPKRGPLYDRPRPKQRPTGRKRLPEHLPADETERQPIQCACGCTDFTWVDEVIEEKLDVRAHQRRRVTRRKTGRCRACTKRTTAEAPPSPFSRSKVTCEWLAWFLHQKFQLLVPLDRIRRALTAQGVPLSMSFLVSQTAQAAGLLETIDGEHWKQLLAGNQLATDGTHLKVQIKGIGLAHAYLEVYHHNDVVVFQFELDKTGDTQASKLSSFVGTLLVDAESRYNQTSELPGILEANCHAHPRRKLRDAQQVQPVLAAEGGRFIEAFFEVQRDARTLGLEGAALVVWRRTHAAPLLSEFRMWSDAVYPTLLPDDALAKVIRYYRNHWTELTVCLDHPVPIDNSACERAFQPIAKMRHNSLFAGSPEGGHRSAILFGLAATCQRMRLDFEAYLAWVFVRRGTHKAKYALSAAQLTPAAYRRFLDAA